MGSACSGARIVRVNIAEEGNGSTANKPPGNWMVGSEVINVQQSEGLAPAAVNKTEPVVTPSATPPKGLASKGVGALIGVLQRNANQVFISANSLNKSNHGKGVESSATSSQNNHCDHDGKDNESNTKSPPSQKKQPLKHTSENEPRSPEGKIIITGNRNYTKEEFEMKTKIFGEYSLRKPKKGKGTNVKKVQESGSKHTEGDPSSKHSNKVMKSEKGDASKVAVTDGDDNDRVKKASLSQDETKPGLITATDCTTNDTNSNIPAIDDDKAHLHLPKSDIQGKASVEQHHADKFLQNMKAKADAVKQSTYQFQMGPGCTCSSCTTPPDAVSLKSRNNLSDNELQSLLSPNDSRRMGALLLGIRRSKSDLLHMPNYDYSWMKVFKCFINSMSSKFKNALFTWS